LPSISIAAATICADLHAGAGPLARDLDPGLAGIGMARNIGHRLAQYQRQATLDVARQVGGQSAVIQMHPGGFQQQSRRSQLGGEIGSADAGNRAAHFCQCVTRHLFRFLNLTPGCVDITVE
jgi:hypothetical protein